MRWRENIYKKKTYLYYYYYLFIFKDQICNNITQKKTPNIFFFYSNMGKRGKRAPSIVP
jgi:hypothetical protein